MAIFAAAETFHFIATASKSEAAHPSPGDDRRPTDIPYSLRITKAGSYIDPGTLSDVRIPGCTYIRDHDNEPWRLLDCAQP